MILIGCEGERADLLQVSVVPLAFGLKFHARSQYFHLFDKEIVDRI